MSELSEEQKFLREVRDDTESALRFYAEPSILRTVLERCARLLRIIEEKEARLLCWHSKSQGHLDQARRNLYGTD